jgi:hypothetical protein
MKLHNIGLHKGSSSFIISSFSGSLIEIIADYKKSDTTLTNKITKSLHFCNQPYSLNVNLIKPKKTTPEHKFNAPLLSKRATLLVYLYRVNLFWFAYKYVSFLKPSFENSSQAIDFFRRQDYSAPQDSLCLPRSLFAASASRRFAEAGVLFLGVFLPSRSMHAWIIEDGRQPDIDDSMWINFRPVAAFC